MLCILFYLFKNVGGTIPVGNTIVNHERVFYIILQRILINKTIKVITFMRVVKQKMTADTGGLSKYIVYFYVLVGVSSLSTVLCLYSIWSHGVKTRSSKLIFLLQLTQLLQNASSLPYYGVDKLCEVTAFIRTYSGFSNVVLGYYMTMAVNDLLFKNEKVASREWHYITKWQLFTIFGFPLITVIPFTTDSYGPIDDQWCSFKDNYVGDIWVIVVFLFWIWIFILASVSTLIVSIYKIRGNVSNIISKVCLGSGLYALATVVCWIPRSILRLGLQYELDKHNHDTFIFMSVVLTYVCGIFYAIIYLHERADLEKYETYYSSVYNFSGHSFFLGGDYDQSLLHNERFSGFTGSDRSSGSTINNHRDSSGSKVSSNENAAIVDEAADAGFLSNA